MKRGILLLCAVVFLLVLWNYFSSQPARETNISAIPVQTNSMERRLARRAQPIAAQSDSTNSQSADEEGVESEKLSREQIEAYLLKTKRSPESLLNAFWETGDTNLLAEAVEKYPDNPIVQWAKLNTLSPEERGPWLEKLKLSSPDNALPNYLSALDNLKAGNVEKGLAEMDSASQKKYSAFEQERMQSREEMYLLSGYSPVEAREAGMSNLSFRNLGEMRGLSAEISNLQKKYIAAGDPDSAQQLVALGIEAGRKLSQPNTIYFADHLVGIAVEASVLQALKADTYVEFLDKTAGERLEELKAQKVEMLKPNPLLYFRLSDTEKLIYWDRVKIYGELEALRWLDKNYADPK